MELTFGYIKYKLLPECIEISNSLIYLKKLNFPEARTSFRLYHYFLSFIFSIKNMG